MNQNTVDTPADAVDPPGEQSACNNLLPAEPPPAETGQESIDEAEREPCPTPLAWQEVLSTFRSDAQPWELQQGAVTLRGRSWGEGPPVYLLPGLGGTHELYALLMYLLREDYRCVTYDELTITGSSRLTPGMLADHLFAVADQQGDRQFNLYASAFGSVAALSAMLTKPDRILAAALQGAYAHRQLSLTERLLIGCGRRLGFRVSSIPLGRTLQTQNHLPWFPPIDQGRWSFFVENTGHVPVSAVASRAAVLREFDVRNRLHEISQPVLLIRTEGEGQLAADCQELLASQIPNTTIERLHSSGQLPWLTHPHRLAKLLKSFFAERDE
jgi:pimeloyl-ACP methyl ester carboxylesterase